MERSFRQESIMNKSNQGGESYLMMKGVEKDMNKCTHILYSDWKN